MPPSVAVEAVCSGNTQSTSGGSGNMSVSAGSRLILLHTQADGVGQPTLTFKWNTTEQLTEVVNYDPQTPWGTGSILAYYLNNPTAGSYAISYAKSAGPRGHYVCCSLTGAGGFPGAIRDGQGNNQASATGIGVTLAAIATDLSVYIGAKSDTSYSTVPYSSATEILDIAIVDGWASAGWKVGETSMGFTDSGGPASCYRSVYAVAIRPPAAGNQVIWMM